MQEANKISKYIERQNSFKGIQIKISDMETSLKFQLISLIRNSIDKFQENSMHLVCEYIIEYLQNKYPGAWSCIIGRRFVANIVHQPGYFIRASTQNYHIVVYMLKFQQNVIRKNSMRTQRVR